MKLSAKKTFQILASMTGLLVLLQTANVLGAASIFSQTISDGSLSIDIVDADGATVGSPSVTFAGKSFSFVYQTSLGTLGADAQRIRVYNPTGTAAWAASIAATGGATALWDTGSVTYDFNDSNTDGTDDADTDTKGGQLTVDPSVGTIAGVSGCATTNISKGSSASFKEVATAVTSITLLTSTTAATYCRWDFTGVGLSQVIPASQPSGAYSLSFTITIS